MNDTEELKRIFLSPPHLSGREAAFVQEAFESNYLSPLGPQVDAFEAEFGRIVNISHNLAVSSGTAAMHLALRVLGIGPGDEVVASTLTFIGGVAPIVYQGRRPCSSIRCRSTWNMDPDLLAEYLEERAKAGPMPKAVVPTDLFGQSADLDRIRESLRPLRDPRGVRRGRVPRRDVPGPVRRKRRQGRDLFVQREQDHHDVRRGDALFGGPGPDRHGRGTCLSKPATLPPTTSIRRWDTITG